MWTALTGLYREAARFARVHPLLFLVPVAAELAQHVVEWRLGMFAGRDAARAVANDPWRMGFGTIKVLALLLPGYWVVRHFTRAEGQAVAPGVPASYWPLLLFQIVLTMFGLWGGRALAAAGLAGLGAFMVALLIVQTLLGLLWTGWTATAPLGGNVAGPIVSSRLMMRHVPWAFAYWLIATAPPIAIHYVLNYAAFGRPMVPAWGLILTDALFVGYLAAIIAGVPVMTWRHVLVRRERLVVLR